MGYIHIYTCTQRIAFGAASFESQIGNTSFHTVKVTYLFVISNMLLCTRNPTSLGVYVYEASFLRLKSRSMISVLRSLLLHFIAERPMSLRVELEIGLHSIRSVASAAVRHSGIAIRRCLRLHARTHPPTHKHCTCIQRLKRKQERMTTKMPQRQLLTHRQAVNKWKIHDYVSIIF